MMNASDAGAANWLDLYSIARLIDQSVVPATPRFTNASH
jgi:hypothetical protein